MSPFDVIARKQKVGQEYANEAELFVLLHFDAAKRRRCTGAGYNFVSRHLVMAYFIAARMKSTGVMKLVQVAGDAWRKAGDRPTDHAALTTTEYLAVRAGLRAYFRALPSIAAGTYRQACEVADKIMQ